MYKNSNKNQILLLPIGAFFLLFIIGLCIPLQLTPHYGNYTSRIWNWTEILIGLTAVYYIVRGRVFNIKQAVTSVLLGAVCLTALFRDSRYIDIIITSICVAAAYYGGCRLFEQSDEENRSIDIGIAGGIKYFILGAAISIPLAFINLFYFSLQGQISFGNFLFQAVYALKPAVSEEVIFRYFLLAYAYHLQRGKTAGRLSSICIYILLVIPHSLIHYPDFLLASPMGAILMVVLNSVVFGFPMALLMKRKNLQMAAGMHWFIDFVRFAAGF